MLKVGSVVRVTPKEPVGEETYYAYCGQILPLVDYYPGVVRGFMEVEGNNLIIVQHLGGPLIFWDQEQVKLESSFEG